MKRAVTAMLVIGLCLVTATAVGGNDGHLEARRLVKEGRILPLEQILDGIRERRPGQVLEIELDDGDRMLIYEIEILDDQGLVWEFKVDAQTGEVIEQELED